MQFHGSMKTARAALRIAGLALPFAGACALVSQPAPAPHAAAGYRIAGQLVNAVTGQPVAHASVAVLTVENRRTVASVLTGSDGHFSLERLPAGKYQLIASKQGYRAGSYEQHDDFDSAILTGAEQETEDLVFRLSPSAQMYVAVTDDNGDPVGNANIQIFRRLYDQGVGGRVVQLLHAVTDDTGAHTFGDLEAGEYFVAVKADPWYAMHVSAHQGSAGSQEPDRPVNPALDVAYPVTFFDGATDESAATPIKLAAGSREEIEIGLHAVPALRISVQANWPQKRPAAPPELRQKIFGMDITDEGANLSADAKPGMIEFSGVAPGHYELTQGDPPRIAELDAAANQQVEPEAGAPMVSVQGTLKTVSGAPLPAGVRVALGCIDWSHPKDPIETTADGDAFRFPAVPPGAWGIWAQVPGETLEVMATTVGGTRRAGNLITVGDRPIQLTVTVNEGGTRIEGVVRKDGKGVSGAMVVLVPQNPDALREMFRRDQSDSDGSFVLRDVAPGSYTVVAIEDGWKLEWARPEVIGRYLASGIPVTVKEQSGKLIQLSSPVPVETR